MVIPLIYQKPDKLFRMSVSIVRWKLKPFLERHRISANALVKQTRLSRNTVYPIVRGESKRISLETLSTISSGLEALTGERVKIQDLLEIEHKPINPWREAMLKKARVMSWDELISKTAPFTPEELEEDERYWEEQDRIRREILAHPQEEL
jgi:DNA-binding Xre family transcriptional regulator